MTIMGLTSLRLGFLLALVVASLEAVAEPRFWLLSGVRFSDGTAATGYFSYDDTTRTVANWNVRVESAPWVPSLPPLMAFTYVPGNSVARSDGPGFYSERAGLSPDVPRSLEMTLLGPLDGKQATVPIHTGPAYYPWSGEYFNTWPCCYRERQFSAGSLVLMSQPPPITIVQVDEYYHPELRHYYITADDAEKRDSTPVSTADGCAQDNRSMLTLREASLQVP